MKKPSGAMVYTVQKGANIVPDLFERGSSVELTQRQAVERAKALSPNGGPKVDRVRHTTGGNPDKWRTP